MAYLIGAILAAVVSGTASLLRLDRDRAFYPTILVVIASYYALFAVMGGSGHALIVEVTVIIIFLAAAGVGFRNSLWVVVAGLVAHGAFDVVHDQLIANPGVPVCGHGSASRTMWWRLGIWPGCYYVGEFQHTRSNPRMQPTGRPGIGLRAGGKLRWRL